MKHSLILFGARYALNRTIIGGNNRLFANSGWFNDVLALFSAAILASQQVSPPTDVTFSQVLHVNSDHLSLGPRPGEFFLLFVTIGQTAPRKILKIFLAGFLKILKMLMMYAAKNRGKVSVGTIEKPRKGVYLLPFIRLRTLWLNYFSVS